MFIIQTRNVINEKYQNPKRGNFWVDYLIKYNTKSEAVDACGRLLENGIHKADDIRVVEVTTTFKTDISVTPIDATSHDGEHTASPTFNKCIECGDPIPTSSKICITCALVYEENSILLTFGNTKL